MSEGKAKLIRSLAIAADEDVRVVKKSIKRSKDFANATVSRVKGIFMGRQNPYHNAPYGEWLTGVYRRRALKRV